MKILPQLKPAFRNTCAMAASPTVAIRASGAIICLLASTVQAAELPLDETPGGPREWGFRPAEGAATATTPPGFSWRPQKMAAVYALQASRDPGFEKIGYQAGDLEFNVHRPAEVFSSGDWFWRFCYYDKAGNQSPWSRPRAFSIPPESKPFSLPARDEILSRIPDRHPRLFLRPEQLPQLRELAKGRLKPVYEELAADCERLIQHPPPTDEPPKYPPDVKRLDERWREIWWGNRQYTIRVLNGAATLGFTHLLDENDAYGQAARKLLLAAAEWDPRGATGYRYNDEAGMPYAYYFSRTYTFIHHLLTPEERELCRNVMQVRGREMARHLNPRHLWEPYSSHSNRAWHFLGEVGLAFHGELEEAEDWVWFAMNVFANVYPVWSDADGGWHEGVSYWRSYISRFTWWADVMKTAVGVDAYRKPYFSQAGYWPMYLQPPGTKAGGFGDLAFTKHAEDNAGLMRILAAQAGNPYWQWYYEALDRPVRADSYIDFVRGALPQVTPKPPRDLPTSRLFAGVGQAVMNTTLLDGSNNISVLFKASPFGTQSHGHEAQNSFQLYAFGRPLLIRTGRRDIHGSDHHRRWMWETKSDNSLLVNGEGQLPHSAAAKAGVQRWHAGQHFDYAEGDATPAYAGKLESFKRGILFLKPEVIIVFDRVRAPSPSTYQWLLHAPTPMEWTSQHQIHVANPPAACVVDILHPSGLTLTQTDQFDPPPRERVSLTQYHLTADTMHPARTQSFVAAIYPHRQGDSPQTGVRWHELDHGFGLEVEGAAHKTFVLLQTNPGHELSLGPLTSDAPVAVARYDARNRLVERFIATGQP